MQTLRLLQAAVLMLLVAIAASCSSGKVYTSRLFAPRIPVSADSTATVLRFLETEEPGINTADWVSTDLINGKDSTGNSAILDQFAKTFPPKANQDQVIIKKDSSSIVKEVKTPAQVTPEEPAPRAVSMNGTRQKKTRSE